MLSSQATVRGPHLHIALKLHLCCTCWLWFVYYVTMPNWLLYYCYYNISNIIAPIQCFLERKCFAIICQHNHSCSLPFSLWPPIDFPHLSVQLKCSSFGKRQSWYLFVTHIDFLATFFLLKGSIGRFICVYPVKYLLGKEWFDP